MFETFQTIINAGGYDLADLTERIKTMYVMGELTEEEMKQLLEQARRLTPSPTIPMLRWPTV